MLLNCAPLALPLTWHRTSSCASWAPIASLSGGMMRSPPRLWPWALTARRRQPQRCQRRMAPLVAAGQARSMGGRSGRWRMRTPGEGGQPLFGFAVMWCEPEIVLRFCTRLQLHHCPSSALLSSLPPLLCRAHGFVFDQAAFIAAFKRKAKVAAFLQQFRNSQASREHYCLFSIVWLKGWLCGQPPRSTEPLLPHPPLF